VGSPWRDVPEGYGSWRAVYGLFRRWQRAGVWAAIMTGLQADADAAGLITWEVSVDSTIARAHQHAAGARTRPQDLKELPGGVVDEPEDHALGRSRGGLTTKIHLSCEQGQKVMSLLVTAGQRGDSPQFQPVLEKIRMPRIGPGHPRRRPARVRADKAYGSRANRAYLRRRGISCTIPVVLLHGFPEFWYAWRHQIPALADAGDRVVTPDLPGYNTSDKPPRVRDYQPRLLAQEVADLITALGAGSATVAGHDWGGGLAWLLAMHHPSGSSGWWSSTRPIRFRKGRPSPGQLRGSWYILAFQAPWLPERLLAARDFRGLRRALGRQPTRPGAFTTQDIDRYVAAAAQPGCPGCRHQLLPGRCARQPLARRRPWVGWRSRP